MSRPANPFRGEASLPLAGSPRLLRPSFAALFWHCLDNRDGLTRDAVGEAVMAMGLAAASQPLRVLLGQILQGRTEPDAP